MKPPGFRPSHPRYIGLIETKSEYGIWPCTKQSHLRLSILIEMSKSFEVGCVQSTMGRRPCSSRYALILVANLETTFASSGTSMMVSIELWSWIDRPGSLQHVRCFEFSFLYPHWGFMMFSSQSKSFELQPHHPETSLVMNVRDILG